MTAKITRGRPRIHDEEVTLQQVVSVFWEHGYEASTYDVLEEATGLRRQSLIYAFGDKRSMFLKALDHYAANRVDEVCRVLAVEPAEVAIRQALAMWKADAMRRTRRGCLMVLMAGEVGPMDRDAAKRIAAARRRLVRAFADAVGRAQREGAVIGDLETEPLAELIVSAGDGALLHARNEQRPGAALPTLKALEDLLFM